ncbi:6-phosphofructokinase [Rurimicrobium arvi]|uniref:ATP-dependent 6-phosphofructokinase n=1 Tax=Rurimicrobium arvi TaxID=2049916 RepID=A0ABP8MTW7_9BACT
MKRIGVMTSGGDSPGMNAAIRAVVRTAIYHKLEVVGIRRGYQGMIDNDMSVMQTTDVSSIIQRGGTVLKTARSKDFMTPEGMKQAYDNLQAQHIDGLVLIGGDGTFRGANAFFDQYAIPAVGLPGTIDKDLSGTDFTIGFDTAVNTAVEAIDKIRDTADAHNRIFVVEVMGRDAGYIALYSGLSCGAEDILIPELKTDMGEVVTRILDDKRRKKDVHIIVVAEGDDFGNAEAVKAVLTDSVPDADIRVCVLGHIQRGGAPSMADRVLASRLGYAAVNALLRGEKQVMIGQINNEIVSTPFKEVVKQSAQIPADMAEMTVVLTA